MRVQSLGREDPLAKEMTTHSSILVWRLPRTEEPGRLQSMGSQSQTRVYTHTQLEFRDIKCIYAVASNTTIHLGLSHLPELKLRT